MAAAGRQDGELSLAEGRGHAVFFRHGGHALVLKHYQRGGRIAVLLGDKYLGINCNRSRAFREWRLLKQMHEMGLPVPAPVAASCSRHGLFHRADLVTRQIENVVTLADRLSVQECERSTWRRIGGCIRRFHDASIYHADLNARNILLDSGNGGVHLVDFDKGCRRYFGEAWKAANLARLQRSLLKFKSLKEIFHFDQDNWDELLKGYNSEEGRVTRDEGRD